MCMRKQEEVKKLMEKLGITEEEALELIAFDNDEIDNEEVEELTKKAKEVKESKKRSPLEKVKNMKKTKKADATKEQIMGAIKTMIEQNPDIFVGAKDMTPTKITFTLNGEFFSISLTKHKKCPDGFSIEEWYYGSEIYT